MNSDIMHVGTKIQLLASMGRAKHLYGPANGVFPQNCKWREKLQAKKGNNVWANMQYEFWNFTSAKWSTEMPQECLLQGEEVTVE